jgi:hypothetical protein
LFPADPVVEEVDRFRWVGAGLGRGELSEGTVRPGGVVVRLVLGQDGAQMPFAEDQHAVEELPAKGADKPLAGRVHARSLDGGAQNPGSDGVERGGEVRSAVADQKLDALEPLAEAEGQVAGLLHGPLARRAGGDPAEVHPPGAMLDEYQNVDALQQHGVHVQEVNREDPGCLGLQELSPGRA